MLKIQLHIHKGLLDITLTIMSIMLVVSCLGVLTGLTSLFRLFIILFGCASACHIIGAVSLVFEATKGTYKSEVDLRDYFKSKALLFVSAIIFDLIYSSLMFFIFYYIPVFFGFVTYKADVNIIYSIMLGLWIVLVCASLFRTFKWCKGNEANVL